MHYYANFKDIGMVPYQLDIYTTKGDGDFELTLCGTPAIVTYESNGLFSPIKSQSCTIEILTETAMLDLYTTDPQDIRVLIRKTDNNLVIFKGYATPCQYGQNWTWKDTLSLECVERLSSLKQVNYSYINGQNANYVPLAKLISYLLSKIESPDLIGQDIDTWSKTIKWYWPKKNFVTVNGANAVTTKDLLDGFALNESNFFDDDQEHTPWTCYEVLEEICKFFNVTLSVYNDTYYFIDYLYVAKEEHSPCIGYWKYTISSLPFDYTVALIPVASDDINMEIMRNLTISTQMSAAGTMEIGLDDVYNKISVNANRYDINQLIYDLYDKSKHLSLTKVENFSGTGDGQTYTESHDNFWGDTEIDNSVTTFKTYCVLDNAPGWKHRWWKPDGNSQHVPTEYVDNNLGYDSSLLSQSQYTVLPENKYINLIGAVILHYAQIQAKTKPSQLDWKDVIMFNCLTDTIKRPINTGNNTQTWTKGKLTAADIFNRVFEKPVLEYTSSDTLNYSPKDGTSWIVINNKLWYQQNKPDIHNIYPSSTGKVPVKVTDTQTHKQIMFPLESATSAPPYVARQYVTGSDDTQYSLPSNNFGGWEMLQMKLQIGDRYWNGSQWTTTPSTFYIKYSGQADDVSDDSNYTFSYLSWMDIVSNTTYQEKVGTDGYAIPITASDKVCGTMKLSIYTPRLLPHGTEYSYISDETLEWYERGPVVFMKDFSVDYVYTDTSEWWLDAEHEKKDLKYTQYNAKRYTYERIVDCKINSWQEGNPIAKSFPILAGFNNNMTLGELATREYVATITDNDFSPNQTLAQEENICSRQLRHYGDPKMKVKMNIHSIIAPWAHVTLNQSFGLGDKIFVVDKQSIDLRNRNNTLELIEFGDTLTH